MNVLIVGNGKGSWAMRGLQLGGALGARVTSTPQPADWKWAEIIVLIKRSAAPHLSTAKATGLPIVWDALDFWAQPGQNSMHEQAARAEFARMISSIQPALTIGATQAQADACGGVYLPHHGWKGLTPTPARPVVKTVAYQGNVGCLGNWSGLVSRFCQKRGWTFQINPADLSAVDLIVALRDGAWDGWACREWKSGVKLTNALLAGRPVITQPSAAWREMQPIGSAITTAVELENALDWWSDEGRRVQTAERCRNLSEPYTLDSITARYQQLLSSVRTPCTVT